MRAICIVSVYSTAKSTYLYSLAGNLPHFLIRQVYTPCRPPAGLLGSLEVNEDSWQGASRHHRPHCLCADSDYISLSRKVRREIMLRIEQPMFGN
jgi:hypothetical protein